MAAAPKEEKNGGGAAEDDDHFKALVNEYYDTLLARGGNGDATVAAALVEVFEVDPYSVDVYERDYSNMGQEQDHDENWKTHGHCISR